MRNQFSPDIKRFLISTLLFGFYFSVWELFFNLYILSLGFDKDLLGLIRAATPLAALVLGLPLGYLSDRIGRKKSMIIGLLVGFTGMLLQIRLLNPWLIFGFGLIQGAGVMLYRVSQPPYLMAASKKETQAMVFSLNFGLITIAGMVGNLIAGQIPTLLENWLGLPKGSAASYQWIITAGVLIASTSVIPVLFISEPGQKRDAQTARISLKAMFTKITKQAFTRQLMFINVLIGFGAALLIPYLNVYLREKFDVGDNLLGLIFSLSSLLVFLGSIITPRLVKLTKSRIIPTVITQGISVVFLFLLGFTPMLWLAIVSLLMRTVLMQMSAPLVENFAMQLSSPEEQGAISGIRGVGWQMGQAAGIYISGLVQSRVGFSPLFITTGVLYSLAVILTWKFFGPSERAIQNDE